MLSRSIAFACSLLGVLACDTKPAPAKPAAAAARAEPAAPTPEPQDPHANPEPLAAAPAGAVAIGRVYVQTCAQPKACPALLQDAGIARCKALGLGGLLWRLPTVAELEAWRGNPALVGYDVFHWSGSAWDEDPAQFWIYDPGSGAKTTAKPDRKAFTIRCVA